MLYNYFNIAVRNLLRNMTHTLINIFGLGLGIASVFLIALYIDGELSYDKFHEGAENIYRISWEDDNPQTRTPHPMAQALAQDFPEVESAVSLSPLWAAGLTRETHSLRNPDNDKWYDESSIIGVDTTFFKVFTFPLIKGDPEKVLKSTTSILISESLSKKYFGTEDAVGKRLNVDGDQYSVEVAGVFKDVPVHSHFHFDILVSYLREKSFDPNDEYYTWRDFGHFNYIRLKPGTNAKELEAKLMDWSRKYIQFNDQQFASLKEQGYGFKLTPIADIHLHSKLRWELEPNGNIEYVYILGAAGILTLLIACINFMNLTTAKSAERAKEIGVRKTLGAFRSQLCLQFLTESVVIAVISLLIAIVIVEISLPVFNNVTGLSFDIGVGQYVLAIVALAVMVGILSGLYPALYLSGVKPHEILKGKFISSRRGSGLRRTLVVFQFAMSMVLISASIIIFSQLDFLRSKNLGFDKEEVIVVPIKNNDGFDKLEFLRNELLKIDGITSVSAASNIPGRQFNQHHITPQKRPLDDVSASDSFVDYDFFETLGIDLSEGRFFLRENPSDTTAAFVINETAAKQLNLQPPVAGQEIVWHGNSNNEVRGTVVGVVKDFHFQSLHQPIQPLVFALTSRAFNHIVIKIDSRDFEKKIAAIERVYKIVEPTFGFEFVFLEESLNTQYAAEQRAGTIIGTFSFIAISIACFGLFGMSMLTFHQKVKEISVRKVLGASSINLLIILLGNFTKLILISILIAVPIVWWIMQDWLGNFSYQVGIHPMIFVGSGLALISISWVTLSYFALKASRLNPAETLKNE